MLDSSTRDQAASAFFGELDSESAESNWKHKLVYYKNPAINFIS